MSFNTKTIKIISIISYFTHFYYTVDSYYSVSEDTLPQLITNKLLNSERNKNNYDQELSSLKETARSLRTLINSHLELIDDIKIVRNYEIISGMTYLHHLEIYNFFITEEINYNCEHEPNAYYKLVELQEEIKRIKKQARPLEAKLKKHIKKKDKYSLPATKLRKDLNILKKRIYKLSIMCNIITAKIVYDDFEDNLTPQDKDQVKNNPKFIPEVYQNILARAKTLSLIPQIIKDEQNTYYNHLLNFLKVKKQLPFDQINSFLTDLAQKITERQNLYQKILKEATTPILIELPEITSLTNQNYINFKNIENTIPFVEADFELLEYEQELANFEKGKPGISNILWLPYDNRDGITDKFCSTELSEFVEKQNRSLKKVKFIINKLNELSQNTNFANQTIIIEENSMMLSGPEDKLRKELGRNLDGRDRTDFHCIPKFKVVLEEMEDILNREISEIVDFIENVVKKQFKSKESFEKGKKEVNEAIIVLIERQDKTMETIMKFLEFQDGFMKSEAEKRRLIILELKDEENSNPEKLRKGYKLKNG